jgi:hypothetical protein
MHRQSITTFLLSLLLGAPQASRPTEQPATHYSGVEWVLDADGHLLGSTALVLEHGLDIRHRQLQLHVVRESPDQGGLFPRESTDTLSMLSTRISPSYSADARLRRDDGPDTEVTARPSGTPAVTSRSRTSSTRRPSRLASTRHAWTRFALPIEPNAHDDVRLTPRASTAAAKVDVATSVQPTARIFAGGGGRNDTAMHATQAGVSARAADIGTRAPMSAQANPSTRAAPPATMSLRERSALCARARAIDVDTRKTRSHTTA